MPKNIIIHLGLHKTATTSLQGFLKANSIEFLSEGVFYFPLNRMRFDVTPLFTSLDRGRRSKLYSLLEEVAQETLLLSDENLIGWPGELSDGNLYPYARNRVLTFCEDMSDARITLFLTLREPHLFLASVYSEILRHSEFVSFEQFHSGFDIREFSYWKAFHWLKELPPNIRVRVIPFETQQGGGVIRIAREIIEEACGPNSKIDATTFPAHRSRTAYSKEELDLAAEISQRASPKMARHFLNALDTQQLRFGETRFEPLTAELADHLGQRYRADLQLFETLRKKEVMGPESSASNFPATSSLC
jgi:hypothetical protein